MGPAEGRGRAGGRCPRRVRRQAGTPHGMPGEGVHQGLLGAVVLGRGALGGHVSLGGCRLCSRCGPAEVRAGAAREARTGKRLELQKRKGGKDRQTGKEVPEL